jgi:hypothetical protein
MQRPVTRSALFALPIVAAAVLAACGSTINESAPTSPTSLPDSSGATAPTIATQPAAQSVAPGSMAKFAVEAAGTAPFTYQWNRSGVAIGGATAASYTTPAVTAADDGATFTVKIANAAGSAMSDAAMLSVSTTSAAGTGTDVTTYKNDLARTGQNLTESILIPSNVVPAQFGLLRKLSVDGKVDAQPLYLSKLSVSGAVHNVAIVATEHDSVYAFDADSGAALWRVSLLGAGETPSDALGCAQVTPEIGITSTPVIDRNAGAHGVIYVVAMSKDGSSGYHQRIHALDVTTGAELLGGPTNISASFSAAGGAATNFEAAQYEERAALLLLNGSIYTSWTSHCDRQPYSGWIIAFNAATLARTAVLNVAPNGGGVGPAIWMGGGGPGADSAGNIYLLTANGAFETTLDANGFPNKQDYANSFLRLSTSGGQLSVADYFTMYNEVQESNDDADLGSSGEMLLPDVTDANGVVRHLVVGAGKDGNIYVVNRDSMGRFSNNIWQELKGIVPGGVRSTPAYFNGTVYYSENGGTLKAFNIAKAMLSTSPSSQTQNHFGYPGTAPTISAKGSANAILWAYENTNPAVLHAYDATNLANEYYNSNQAAANRDQFGTGNKFIAPTVADGKVFVATTSGVAVFGLLH